MLKFVYGCIALTLAAVLVVVVLLISDDNEQPRYLQLVEAIEHGATVLAADKHGAITLTANGGVKGWTRDGELVWERSYDRQDDVNRSELSAKAICFSDCPRALLFLPGRVEGVGGADPAGSLARAITEQDLDVLATVGERSLFVDRKTGNTSELQYATAVVGDVPAAPTLQSIAVRGPTYVGVAGSEQRAVVGSVGDDNDRSAVRVRPLELSGRDWQPASGAIAQPSTTNACISQDGEWIGVVGDRVRLARFGDEDDTPLGPPITSGTCTADAKGISAVTIPAGQNENVFATRFTPSGETLWRHALGDVKLLSDADAVNFVFREKPSGPVRVLSATSGDQIYSVNAKDDPFAADDGSLVLADRKGEPRWLPVPDGG